MAAKFIRRAVIAIAAVLATQPLLAGTLASPEQLDHERALLHVLARPEMRAATARVERLYQADAQARARAGKARLKRAASSIATAAANYALFEDASRPGVIWSVNAPHRWHGLSVPGSGFGIDNPDNVYQGFTVDGNGRYLLRGHMPSSGPVQLHFEVRDSIPGMGEMLVEGGKMLATIQSEEISFAPDGSFEIPIDSAPIGGRRNHFAVPAGGIYMINVRQLFTDWSKQKPADLKLVRLDPVPPPAPRNIPAFARRSVEILDRIAPYWLAYDNRFMFAPPVNRIGKVRVRPGGRGMSASGHYALADDEALVMTIDALGGASLGVQIADPWGVAYDYDTRTSSLNNTQAQMDVAGTFTFIISARDPGYANWLDSGGFASGMAVLRWQALPPDADPAKAIRNVEVVKLADLAARLPAGQTRLTPAQRAKQRAKRAADYAVRLAD